MSNSIPTLEDNFKQSLNKDIWHIYPRYEDHIGFENESLKISVNNSIRSEKDEKSLHPKKVDRVEIAEKESVLVPLGNEVSYSFDFFFPEDFLVVDNRLVFAQWKQYALHYGSPFLSARYENGKFMFKVVSENMSKKFKKKIDLRGAWHTLKLNYKLSKNQSGFAKGWLDGKLVMDYQGEMDYYPAPKYAFMKIGLYRDSINTPQTIYFRNFKRSLK